MEDQFDNRNKSDFSMSGDVFNHNDKSYNKDNIPGMSNNQYKNYYDKTMLVDDDNDDEEESWRAVMTNDLRNDVIKSNQDPMICAIHDMKKGKNIILKKNNPEERTIAIKDKDELPHKLSNTDPKLIEEIKMCKEKISELKSIIDNADKNGLSTYLKNRINKQYENKQYELKCLNESLDPNGASMAKMELLRAKFFDLEKQKSEIEMQMQSIELKFRSENMSIEEIDTKPEIESLIQDQEDDTDRLWKLRANRRKIYEAEYNVDQKTGVTTHDKADFKNSGFMRKQLVAHNARKIIERNS